MYSISSSRLVIFLNFTFPFFTSSIVSSSPSLISLFPILINSVALLRLVIYQNILSIVTKEAHRKVNSTNIKSLNIDDITTNNQQLIAETSNNYFISIAENTENKDRNAYVKNKNTPYNTKIDASPQDVKEVNKSR